MFIWSYAVVCYNQRNIVTYISVRYYIQTILPIIHQIKILPVTYWALFFTLCLTVCLRLLRDGTTHQNDLYLLLFHKLRAPTQILRFHNEIKLLIRNLTSHITAFKRKFFYTKMLSNYSVLFSSFTRSQAGIGWMIISKMAKALKLG